MHRAELVGERGQPVARDDRLEAQLARLLQPGVAVLLDPRHRDFRSGLPAGERREDADDARAGEHDPLAAEVTQQLRTVCGDRRRLDQRPRRDRQCTRHPLHERPLHADELRHATVVAQSLHAPLLTELHVTARAVLAAPAALNGDEGDRVVDLQARHVLSPSLVDALVDDSPQVQFAALEALEKIGLCNESAFIFVEDIFSDDGESRFADVVALKALGLYGDRALELIREWVRDPHDAVVASVNDILTPDSPIRKIIEFLGRVSIPEANAALEQLLSSQHDSWRLRAAIVLQKDHGESHQQAISTLNALKDAYPDGNIGATAERYLRKAAR